MRNLLLDKFRSHLISKDLINLKQTLTERENNDISVTKLTIKDKDCAEIAALGKYFPGATHILCHFHVLKAVDAFLTKTKNGAGDKEKYHDI
ncbi:hypothetical protein DAPPUDRAFT_247007 [Daphnia pulex]|uniref:MULE transposase domain-containing protein n=1 Tax=Daphnia pulex TaxID=6669 RepID=E9GRL1_DAPPU|nr:hypothetical protein DAPPUDRAFT_247007 [Daphnia pulex]|eukprot:EFX77894.1 hypothetical protein DAPPUDRAFT_247007 [Daphnia pulex]